MCLGFGVVSNVRGDACRVWAPIVQKNSARVRVCVQMKKYACRCQFRYREIERDTGRQTEREREKERIERKE